MSWVVSQTYRNWGSGKEKRLVVSFDFPAVFFHFAATQTDYTSALRSQGIYFSEEVGRSYVTSCEDWR